MRDFSRSYPSLSQQRCKSALFQLIKYRLPAPGNTGGTQLRLGEAEDYANVKRYDDTLIAEIARSEQFRSLISIDMIPQRAIILAIKR